MSNRFATVPEAIDELVRCRMIVVIDDEDRENEGDLTLAAEVIPLCKSGQALDHHSLSS